MVSIDRVGVIGGAQVGAGIAEAGHATAADIDAAMKLGANRPMDHWSYSTSSGWAR